MKSFRRMWLPIAVACAFVAAQFLLSDYLGVLRERTFDIYQQMLPRDVPLDQVAVVTIDEQSLASVGRWPWPREKVGEIVSLIHQSGAVAIGVDILFSEPDSSADGARSDTEFASVLRDTPTVLAMTLTDDDAKLGIEAKTGFSFIGDQEIPIVSSSSGGLAPVEPLAIAASGLGVIRAFTDDDGRMRAIPLLWAEEAGQDVFRYWPTFSMEMLRVAQAADAFAVRSFGTVDDAIKVGQVVVPMGDGRLRLIDVPDAPMHLSAMALLNSGPQPVLANRIVVLAVEAAGVDRYHVTARGTTRFGPDLHAMAVSQMLSGTYLMRASDPVLLEASLFVGFAALMVAGFFLLGRSPILATTAACVISIFPLAIGLWFYFERDLLVDAGLPTIGLLITGVSGGYALYREAEAKRVSLQKQFSQFLSPEVVNRLAETDNEAALAVEDKTITIMLLDVRGFTAMSEKYGAKRTVDVMNHFFSIASDEIFKRNGTVDKYMGDAVMAFWNAPLALADHADLAVDCAQAIIDRVARENYILERQDLPPIRIVAVLETGICSVGNMGTRERVDYTAVGPAVNLVSRLEKFAKDDGHLLVTGPGCAASLSRPMLKIANVEARGFREPVDVYVP